MSIPKIILYLAIISGFFGSAFLTFNIGPFSLFPFRIFLLLLWFIFIFGLFLRKGKLDISYIKTKGYLLFLLFWLFWAFLSFGWAEDKAEAIRDIIFLFMGCSLIFFTVFYLRRLKDFKRLYYIWIVVLIILIPIGFWERFTGNHLPVSGLFESTHRIAKFMPTTVFQNPNDFATFLVLTFPFLLSFLRHNKGFFRKLFIILLILCSLYLLLFTYSRANYLALTFEFFFVFLFLFRLKSKFKAIITIALIILALVIIFPEQFSSITGLFKEQISSLFSQLGVETASVEIRINLIKNSLLCLQKSFGFGIGAGNAEYCIENYGKYWTKGIINVHNWWFEILTEYGIFVFGGYLIFYLNLIRALYKKHKQLITKNLQLKTKNKQQANDNKQLITEKMICEALLVSLVGFFLASISSSSIMAFNPHWLLFAFSLAFLNYTKLTTKSSS